MSARGYFGALSKARKFWAAENARYFRDSDATATAAPCGDMAAPQDLRWRKYAR